MSLSNLLIIFSSSFMALFPVVNPLGNGFVVNGFFTDLDPKQRCGYFGHRPPVFVNVRTGHPCHSVGRWDTYL